MGVYGSPKPAAVSIVTAWHNHPELLPAYEAAVTGAQVVVIDNGSEIEPGMALFEMVQRLDGVMVRNSKNEWFAAACNEGLKHATGEIVLMLNNDIIAEPGWLAQVARDVKPNGLYGPEVGYRRVAGQHIAYVDGWCVAARREVWDRLGGFDAVTFQRPYWEDVDLSWRAVRAGCTLHLTRWPVRHLSNTTSRTVAGAYDGSEPNRAAFEDKVRREL